MRHMTIGMDQPKPWSAQQAHHDGIRFAFVVASACIISPVMSVINRYATSTCKPEYRTGGLRLEKARGILAWKSRSAMLVAAGSTWGGSGGDKWPEALQEKAPLGSQQAMRVTTRSEH